MKRKSGERGIGLVEMIVATAITGMIFAVLGTAMYQVVTIPESGNDRLTSLHELQNAAHWVNLDGQAATGATGGDGLVLTTADNATITYSLTGTDLIRTIGGDSMTLAQNISALSFSVNGSSITMNISAAGGGEEATGASLTYLTYRRPSED